MVIACILIFMCLIISMKYKIIFRKHSHIDKKTAALLYNGSYNYKSNFYKQIGFVKEKVAIDNTYQEFNRRGWIWICLHRQGKEKSVQEVLSAPVVIAIILLAIMLEN